jgi:uncharacterized membrane protein YkoI
MNRFPKIAAATAIVAFAVSTSWLKADDEDALAKAPVAVQSVVKSLLGSNKLAGFDPETTDGKTTYEVSIEIKGSDYGAVVSDTGTILEREVDVDLSMVPPEVLDAAKNAHADGKISEASIVSAEGKLFYSLDVKVAKDTHEMKVSATGNVLEDKIEPPEANHGDEKPEADEKKD